MQNQSISAVPSTNGDVNIDELVKNVASKIPPKLKSVFDKAILSGMRIMFSKESHGQMLEQLDKPGDMSQKLVLGARALILMLWEQSNKTLPPQILIPVGVVLTMRAFEFLQKSGDPQATGDVLGDALADLVEGLMNEFGATEDKLREMAAQESGAKQTGLIGA